MNAFRSMIAIAAICAACSVAPEVPLEVRVIETPELVVDVPAQLLLDVRAGVPTDGIEIAVEADQGLRVVDYAPRTLPATNPTAGSQLFVDLVPKVRGDQLLTVRLTVHMGGDKLTRMVTLSLAVSRPISVPGGP